MATALSSIHKRHLAWRTVKELTRTALLVFALAAIPANPFQSVVLIVLSGCYLKILSSASGLILVRSFDRLERMELTQMWADQMGHSGVSEKVREMVAEDEENIPATSIEAAISGFFAVINDLILLVAVALVLLEVLV